MSKASYLLLAVLTLSLLGILYQVVTLRFSIYGYLLVVTLFISTTVLCVMLEREIVAFFATLIFSTLFRMLYYVSTHFSVLPFGDPYGQYGVLEAFSSTSHISLLFPTHIFGFQNPLAASAYQYSQWPGFEVLALAMSRAAGLSLFQTALVFPILLYVAFFILAYALLRKITSRIHFLPNFAAFCLTVSMATPFFEVPPLFKYDFLSTMLVVVGILLVVRIFERPHRKEELEIIVITMAIVVTHNITAVAWLLILGLVPLVFWFQTRFGKSQSRFEDDGGNSKSIRPLTETFLIGLVVTLIW